MKVINGEVEQKLKDLQYLLERPGVDPEWKVVKALKLVIKIKELIDESN